LPEKFREKREFIAVTSFCGVPVSRKASLPPEIRSGRPRPTLFYEDGNNLPQNGKENVQNITITIFYNFRFDPDEAGDLKAHGSGANAVFARVFEG